MKRQPYLIQKAFKDSKKVLGSKAIQDYKTFLKFLGGVFYDLNRAIIVDKYWWKIPNMAGSLGISINGKTHKIYWLWDRGGNYCRGIPKARLWKFEPCVGWRGAEIGQRGLNKHIVECKLDPRKPRYQIFKKLPRRRFRGEGSRL